MLRASPSLRCAAVALAAGLTVPFVTPALGQTDQERAQARAAATAGAKAFADGQWVQAVDLFKRAESVVHAPTLLLYLARSEEKLGHLVAAQEAYLKVVKETLPAKAPAAFREAQSAAQAELGTLEPRIPLLTIVVEGPGAADAAIALDGQAIPAAVLGVPSPADPGDHEVRAEVEGNAPVVSRVSLREGAKETVRLAAPAKVAAAPVAAQPLPARAAVSAEPARGGHAVKYAAYGAIGVGVVGVGLGTFFAIRRSGKVSDAESLCTGAGGACGTSKRAQLDELDFQAASAGTMSVVGFAVGGVGLATGITLLVLGGKSKPAEGAAMGVHVQPWVGASAAGVLGTF